ncbi:class I SAM-dependent methyltransferase [Nigerium massiliense]|uniref:class I SAM-dependent methyltransferase n=1 Tax=Nigerium massiliense TaxID=1522317 RepID=UPI00058B1AB1|nr:class I SAM-dependent methyltransferase [Nigerium massiliense]
MTERDAVRDAYDAVADTYADFFAGVVPESPVDLALIAHFCALLPAPRDVLDAGCGPGRMLPLLASRGCRVRGLDLSPQFVRRARADHPGFDVTVGSLTALPYPDASFDGVFAWYSTIHSPDADVRAFLAEARRTLRPGGHVLLGFQSGDGTVRDVGQAFRDRGHDVVLLRHHRPVDAVVALAEEADLEVVLRFERAPLVSEADPQAAVVARRVALAQGAVP